MKGREGKRKGKESERKGREGEERKREGGMFEYRCESSNGMGGREGEAEGERTFDLFRERKKD